ncbi:MAG: sulfatase [Verrucomicrobiae bacterium]|nr:sulfatase [Verrucomicrobiae bacterium]
MRRLIPVLCATACLLAQTLFAAPRPNVVLIIPDDQTYRDFGFMGNPLVKTPHLDKLAAQSARYPNGYVPTSVCSPSLATLLTGLYPHQHGIHYNHPPPGNAAFNKMTSAAEYERVRGRSFYLIQSVPTLPRVLAQNGYRCLQTGKFWEGHYRNAGFTDGMTLFKADAQLAYNKRKMPDGTFVAHGNGDYGLTIGRDTMQPITDFLDACGKEQPFLIWYAPFLPHQPHDSPKKFYDLYKNTPGLPEHQVPYYAAISQFDDTVGQLIGEIERRGLAGNTLFVLCTDNGWTASTQRERSRPEEFAHTRESKRSPFEDGLRTPILFRWDGRVKPATHDALVSSVDVVPTIVSAVGLKAAIAKLPGVDLLPSAKGESPAPARPVFGEIYPGDATALGEPSRDIAYRWVRSGDYKLIVPHRHNGKKPWEEFLLQPALFNVATDPGEKNDLSSAPAHAGRLKELRRLLDDWWTPGDDSAVPKPK